MSWVFRHLPLPEFSLHCHTFRVQLLAFSFQLYFQRTVFILSLLSSPSGAFIIQKQYYYSSLQCYTSLSPLGDYTLALRHCNVIMYT